METISLIPFAPRFALLPSIQSHLKGFASGHTLLQQVSLPTQWTLWASKKSKPSHSPIPFEMATTGIYSGSFPPYSRSEGRGLKLWPDRCCLSRCLKAWPGLEALPSPLPSFGAIKEVWGVAWQESPVPSFASNDCRKDTSPPPFLSSPSLSLLF